jgi:DNA-directed RNA polymerase specialized sigma24 family protein
MKICFNEARTNPYYKAILSKFNKLKIPKEEIDQYKLICLWESIRTFDESKSAFHTHLYNNCRFMMLKFYTKDKKQRDRFTNLNHEPLYFEYKYDFLEGLPKFYYCLIEDRYISKLTMLEISRKYSISQKMANNIIEEAKGFISERLKCI